MVVPRGTVWIKFNHRKLLSGSIFPYFHLSLSDAALTTWSITRSLVRIYSEASLIYLFVAHNAAIYPRRGVNVVTSCKKQHLKSLFDTNSEPSWAFPGISWSLSSKFTWYKIIQHSITNSILSLYYTRHPSSPNGTSPAGPQIPSRHLFDVPPAWKRNKFYSTMSDLGLFERICDSLGIFHLPESTAFYVRYWIFCTSIGRVTKHPQSSLKERNHGKDFCHYFNPGSQKHFHHTQSAVGQVFSCYWLVTLLSHILPMVDGRGVFTTPITAVNLNRHPRKP